LKEPKNTWQKSRGNMVTPNVVVTALLNTNPALVAALTPAGAQVPQLYSPRLSPGWKPASGPAISYFIRGGPEPSLYTPYVEPSVQITTWASTPKLARQVHGLAFSTIHGCDMQLVATQDGNVKILWGKAETFPQDIVDPETGWFTVTSFFEIAMFLEPQS
jgi:hypothetical protein